MEEELLAWKRNNELPSNLVGMCYKKYKKDPERYVGLIKEIIEHNYYDLYSMPLILQKLLDLKWKNLNFWLILNIGMWIDKNLDIISLNKQSQDKITKRDDEE